MYGDLLENQFCHNFDSSSPILTFKIPNSINFGSRNWFLVSKVRSHCWFLNEMSAKSHFCIYTHSTALNIKKGTLLHKYVWLWGLKNASVDEIKSWRALHSLIWLHFQNIRPTSENVKQKCIIIDFPKL